MKNTIISIIIFLSLLGFVTYANSSLNKLCTTIKKDTKEIYFLIEKDNWNEAYSKSNDLIKNINDKNLILSIYLNHNDFDEILDEAIELSLYIHGKEKTKFKEIVDMYSKNKEIVLCKLNGKYYELDEEILNEGFLEFIDVNSEVFLCL